MTWFAIQYKPAQGDRAVLNLENQGIACFHPKVPVEKIRQSKRVCREEPLFPGYMFIQLESHDPNWSTLRSTRGVLRVVSFANKPAAIADTVIDHIKLGLQQVTDIGGIKPGQPIELDDGPFKGLPAIFQAYDGAERAVVLINFMQSQQRLAVSVGGIRS